MRLIQMTILCLFLMGQFLHAADNEPLAGDTLEWQKDGVDWTNKVKMYLEYNDLKDTLGEYDIGISEYISHDEPLLSGTIDYDFEGTEEDPSYTIVRSGFITSPRRLERKQYARMPGTCGSNIHV